jgi:hypothetical protein
LGEPEINALVIKITGMVRAWAFDQLIAKRIIKLDFSYRIV